MFKLLNRYKKGVSPVIAVVLLIALTVAAAAVIWAVTQGLIGGGTASLTAKNASGTIATNDLNVDVVLTASEAVTVSQVEISNGTVSVIGTIDDGNLDSGDNSVTLTFTRTGGWDPGSYDVEVTFAAEGGSDTIVEFSVNAS